MRNKREAAPQLARVVTLATADVAVLWLARPRPNRLVRLVQSPDASLARLGGDECVALIARAALWSVAAWVALALFTVCGAHLPGLTGRGCRALASVAAPAAMRRVLFGAVGLGVGVGLFVGPTTSAALASPPAAAARHPVACAPLVARDMASVDESLPAPPWPGSPSAGHHHPAPTRHEPAGRVQVHRGDSLWLIAARRLGPDATPSRTAAYWPKVYAANRTAIGANPDLISPNQVLHLPAPDLTHKGVQR